MSNLFERLAARAAGGPPPLAPRRPHRFEAGVGRGIVDETVGSEIESSPAIPSPPQAPQRRLRLEGIEPFRPVSPDPPDLGALVPGAQPTPGARSSGSAAGATRPGGGDGPEASAKARGQGTETVLFDGPARGHEGTGTMAAVRREGPAGVAASTGGRRDGTVSRVSAPSARRSDAARVAAVAGGPRSRGTSEAATGEAGEATGSEGSRDPFASPGTVASPLEPLASRWREDRVGGVPESARRAGTATLSARSPLTETPPAETIVRVTIGTVVVRAAAPAAQTEARGPGLAEPRTSLAQYLERRGGKP